MSLLALLASIAFFSLLNLCRAPSSQFATHFAPLCTAWTCILSIPIAHGIFNEINPPRQAPRSTVDVSASMTTTTQQQRLRTSVAAPLRSAVSSSSSARASRGSSLVVKAAGGTVRVSRGFAFE